MKEKSLLWLIVIAVVAFVAYNVYQDAKAHPENYTPPPPPPAGQPRTLLQSINDLSYNLLFGWWLGH